MHVWLWHYDFILLQKSDKIQVIAFTAFNKTHEVWNQKFNVTLNKNSFDFID